MGQAFLGLRGEVDENPALERHLSDIALSLRVHNVARNLVRDGFGAAGRPVNGFGIAQYASYTLTETVALNGQVEYWRDDNNFFVASFPSNSGPVMVQQGFAVPFLHTAPGTNTTYGALTLGVTWKPALPTPVSGLLIRPEVRWDHAFTDNRPFNAQRDNNALTLGADAVLTF